MRISVFLFLVLQAVVLFPVDEVLAENVTVAVLPFRMNAGEPIGFIGDGVRDMLTSRIGSGPLISVVKQSLVREALAQSNDSELTEEVAVDVGRTLQVDYVVFGSISKIGNNVSVDVTLLDVEMGGTVTSVFSQSLVLDEVVPHMNALAQGINQAIATRDKTPPVELPLAGTPSAETPGTQPLEDVGALFKESPVGDDVSDNGNNDFEFEEAGKLFETDKPDSPGMSGVEETELETPETDESEQENLAERLLKRKSSIDSTDENPAYQKSIDELQDSPESVTEDTSQ